jgi:hypothetical protein
MHHVSLRVLSAAAGMALCAAAVAPASAELLITVDKSSQRMIVALDDVPLYDWPVSTGQRGYDTPDGLFKPFRMEADHFSREWDDAPMPHSIFFTQIGHAIHGSHDIKHLGRPASHGCVRLSPEHAAILFKLVRKEKMANTQVVLTGEIPGGAGKPPHDLGGDLYAEDEALVGWRPPVAAPEPEQTRPKPVAASPRRAQRTRRTAQPYRYERAERRYGYDWSPSLADDLFGRR